MSPTSSTETSSVRGATDEVSLGFVVSSAGRANGGGYDALLRFSVDGHAQGNFGAGQVAQTQKQDDAPAGKVIAQSLPPGSGAVKGASIILTVSLGPPQVQVPNVSNLGYSFDQAAQILQQAGLQAVKVVDFPGGQVRQQNPAPNTTVPSGTQVQLWVMP